MDWFRISVSLSTLHTTRRTSILLFSSYVTTELLCYNYVTSMVSDPFFSTLQVASSHSIPCSFLFHFQAMHTANPIHWRSHHYRSSQQPIPLIQPFHQLKLCEGLNKQRIFVMISVIWFLPASLAHGQDNNALVAVFEDWYL